MQGLKYLSCREDSPYDEVPMWCEAPTNGSLLGVPNESPSGSAGVGPKDSWTPVRSILPEAGTQLTESAFLISSAE